MPLPFPAEDAVRQKHGVDDRWLPSRTSAQVLADRVNVLGTYLRQADTGESRWVGVPLAVHRRCDEPMFGIVNAVAYDGMMIHGGHRTDDLPLPPSCWIDVPNPAFEEFRGNWSPEEGRHVQELLSRLLPIMSSATPDGQLPVSPDIIMLGPFRAVAGELEEMARRFRLRRDRVGTVHRAQGKEADVVILVLGGKTEGARNWAAEKPNLVNVAASRAKRRLYVIGDRTSWSRRSYFKTLAQCLPADGWTRPPDAT